MSSEVLLSNIIPFAGSGLIGYAMGFEKDFEVDADYCLLASIAKVWLSGMLFVGV
jgi:hypothetical protein